MEPHEDFDYAALDQPLEDIQTTARDVYRAAAEKFMPVLHAALDWQQDTPQKWAIMFATAHPDCQGRSMADVAAELGVTRALLSGLATRFCRERGLPPSTYMRSEAAARVARLVRVAYVAKNNGSRHNGKG